MPRLPATPIKDSQLYKNECVRLAGRISPRKLLIELNKVHRAGVQISNSHDICAAFVWEGTPQGTDFWSKVYFGD